MAIKIYNDRSNMVNNHKKERSEKHEWAFVSHSIPIESQMYDKIYNE